MLKKIFVLILFSPFFFSSCKRAKNITNNKTLSINFFYNPITIDPRKKSDPVTSTFHFMLYDGLTHLEEDGSVTNAIADHIEISGDKLKYTFHLKDTFWSDGSKLTAYDFEASWKTVLEPDFPSAVAGLFYPIKNAENAKKGLRSINDVGITAKDPLTLVIELERPTPYFLELTAYSAYFPLPSQIAQSKNNFDVNHNRIFNGPFALKKWKQDHEIILRKNPKFWNEEHVKLDQIHISLVQNEETALQIYHKNKLHFLGGFTSPLPVCSLPKLKSEQQLKIVQTSGANFCTFNLKSPIFKNINIRKAFANAIDKESIVKDITTLDEVVADRLIPTFMKKKGIEIVYQDAKKITPLEFLEFGLQELGLQKKDLPPITYAYFNTELQKNIAASLQSTWLKSLGIKVELHQYDLQYFLQLLHSKEFEIAQMSWITQYTDPMNILERFEDKNSCKNYGSFENKNYQKFLQDSFYAKNLDDRNNLIQKAENILLDELPIQALYFYNYVYIQKEFLKNVQISPIGTCLFHYAYLENQPT